MSALGIAMVDCAVQVTLFVFAAAAIDLAAARRDPAAAARTVLASMIGVTLLTAVCWSPWPNWSDALERSWALADTHAGGIAADVAGPPLDTSAAVRNGANATAQPADAAPWSTPLRAMWEDVRNVWAADDAAPQPVAGWSWRTLAFGAFVAAATLGFGRLFAGMACVASLRRRSTPLHEAQLTELTNILCAELGCSSTVALGESQRLTTAATIGWTNPLVLLPGTWRRWSPRELRAVLAHEIAHVQRRDFASHLLAQVSLALHFYHPLVHWLLHRLRLEQELAADAAAARLAGGPQSYLATLAGLALAQPAARSAWPVHAFVPTRHMFLRRIEMLRDRRMPAAASRAIRAKQNAVGWLTAFMLCAAGLAVVGLRAPTTARAQSQVDVTPARTEAAAAPDTAKADYIIWRAPKYDFSYVPENTMALVAIRQAELAADPRLKPLAELIEQTTRPALPSNLVEQVALLMIAPKLDEQGQVRVSSGGEQVVMHTTEAVDFMPHLKKGYPNLTTMQDGGRGLMVISPSPSTMSFFTPNKQTLLGRVRSELVELVNSADAAGPPRGAEAWQAAAKGPILVVAQTGPASIIFKGRADVVTAVLTPMLTGTETVLLSVDPSENLTLHGRLICKSADDAKRVAETTESLAVTARSMVQMQQNKAAADAVSHTNVKLLLTRLESCLEGRKITTQGNDVLVELSLGNTADAVKEIVETVAPAIQESRAAARNAVSINNLKQIAIAMHMYHDAHGHLPAAALVGPDGNTPHSWRVALLPYLGHDELYKEYHLDQPWDSPDNLKVLAQLPDVYRHPEDVSDSSNASYFVLVGPDTVFAHTDGTGMPISKIADGASKTLLAVEAKRDIPWTKPEDIEYAADQPVPPLGEWMPRSANVAFCDGSVRTLRLNMLDEQVLRALITRSGGEPDVVRE